MADGETTLLLRDLTRGDAAAHARLAEIVYAELRAIAASIRGRASHDTLQPTALVHEAWLRLVASPERSFENRRHFVGVAARAMRSVLVDHVRRKQAHKRGGELEVVELDQTIDALRSSDAEMLDLDLALEELARDDAELVELVELRFFGGLSHAEIAELKGCSLSTVERTWRVARARLHRRLSSDAPR